MKFNIVNIILILLASTATVNGYDTWTRTFDCEGSCWELFALPPVDGNIIIACFYYVHPSGYNTWLAQVNETGEINWQYTFDIPPRGLAPVPGGGCVALLNMWYDSMLLKLDSSGNTVWSIDLPVTVSCLHTTADNDLILFYDGQLQKRDENGAVIWTVPIPSQMNYISCFGDAPSQAEGFTISGVEENLFLLGISDSTGAVPWTGDFQDPYYEYASTPAIFSDNEGNCYGCVKYSTAYPPPDAVAWVLIVNNGGTLGWSNEYDDAGGGICPSPDGNIVVAGSSGDGNFYIRFLDSSTGGTSTYVQHGIPGPGSTLYPHSIVPCAAGGYLIGGSAGSDGIFLARTDSLGLINGTGIEQRDVSLLQVAVAPNPVSTSTTISFSNPTAGRISVRIYDLAGREIASLADGSGNEGNQSVVWNLTDACGRDVPSGFYNVVVAASDAVVARRIVIIR